MLCMTKAAAGFLTAVLDEARVSRDTAVRLTRKGEGFSFSSSLDTVRPGDITISHSGRNVLLMDAVTSAVLTNRSLDVKVTGSGIRLQIC